MTQIQLPVAGSRSSAQPAERRWVFIFSILVMGLTTIPYLLGFAGQGRNWQFSGFVFSLEDGNSYIANMLSGAQGAWLFRTPYTAYPQQGVLLFLPYLLLGKLAAPPGLHAQLVALYQIYRFLAGILCILATYDFLAYFLKDIFFRRIGLVIATLGGGLGWLILLFGKSTLFGSLPLEFYSPETFGFLGIYGIPHIALARALLFWSLVLYLRTLATEDRKKNIFIPGIEIGLLWLVAGFAQPLVAVLIGVVIGAYLIARMIPLILQQVQGKHPIWAIWMDAFDLALLAALLPICFLIYYAWSIFNDPFLQAWSAQNILKSPEPLHYLLAYGLILPFAIAGGGKLLQRFPRQGWLPVTWALLLPILASAPTNLQRRLPDGVWVALTLLAMSAFEGLRQKKLVAIFALLFPSTILIFIGGLVAASKPALPLFLPVAETRLFQALRTRAAPGDIVLTSFDTGNNLPAWTPLRVVIGHGPLSVHLADLEPKVTRFYQTATPDAERLGLLLDQHVRFVFWGPSERSLGGWDPHQAWYLQPGGQDGPYQFFEVKP